MKQLIDSRLIFRVCVICTLLLVGGMVGNWITSDSAHAQVRQDVRRNDTRAAFLSGSERSEQVLREISQTLKTIDQRLARLEKMAVAP